MVFPRSVDLTARLKTAEIRGRSPGSTAPVPGAVDLTFSAPSPSSSRTRKLKRRVLRMGLPWDVMSFRTSTRIVSPLLNRVLSARRKTIVSFGSVLGAGSFESLASAGGAGAGAAPAPLFLKSSTVCPRLTLLPRVSTRVPVYGAEDRLPVTEMFAGSVTFRSEEHTSELQSQSNLVCRLLLEKKKNYR